MFFFNLTFCKIQNNLKRIYEIWMFYNLKLLQNIRSENIDGKVEISV